MSVTHWRYKPAVSGTGDLCRQNDGFTRLRFQPAADDLFGASEQLGGRRNRIHFCRVVEINARIIGSIHDFERQLFVALSPKRHRAHAENRNSQRAGAQSSSVHGMRFRSGRRLAARLTIRVVAQKGCRGKDYNRHATRRNRPDDKHGNDPMLANTRIHRSERSGGSTPAPLLCLTGKLRHDLTDHSSLRHHFVRSPE